MRGSRDGASSLNCISYKERKRENMEKTKKTAIILLAVSLAVILLSGIVTSVIQTDGGNATMKEVFLQTDKGYTMCAYLFIPKTATAENPAPAVVTSHGLYNNKEMQDANFVELVRRGFVVLAIDQAKHGDSEITGGGGFSGWDGVYQGALMLSRQPFVDKSRIGVTGHSMGGMSSNSAIREDNAAETQIISAVLLNCANPTVSPADYYGTRKAGVLAAMYDEFFFTQRKEDGTTLRAPYYMESENAQSFLYFGEDHTDKEARVPGEYYTKTIDGVETFHVIYQPDIIHPWSHFSKKATTSVIDFFDKALGSPNPIPSSNQVWQWKEAFNFIGYLGWMLFICSFCVVLVYTPTFASLRPEKAPEAAHVEGKTGKLWFWCLLAAGALFGTLVYRPIVDYGRGLSVAQSETMGLGLWSTACGVFAILSMLVYYFCYGRKHGYDGKATGVNLGVKNLLKTVVLAVIVLTVAYGILFTLDYFFYADFRLWTLSIKAFEAPILRYLPYVLLFFTYYIAASVAANCFNFNDATGKKSWVNTLILAVFNAIPALVLPWIQYWHYYHAKDMMWPSSNMSVLWLFPIVIILIVTTVVDRIVYKRTKNAYLPGIINAVIVGLMTITNTSTTLM